MSDPSPRFTQGMVTRRKVLGDKHVDNAIANTTPFNAEFQTLITEFRLGLGLVARDDFAARALDADHRAAGRAGA